MKSFFSNRDKKQKVCFVATYLYPAIFNQAGHGGAEIQLLRWIDILNEIGGYKTFAIVGSFGQARVLKYNGIGIYRNQFLNSASIARFITPFLIFAQLIYLRPQYIVGGGSGLLTIFLSYYSRFTKAKYIHRMASIADVDGTRHAALGILKKPFVRSLRYASISVQNAEQQNVLWDRYGLKSQIIKNVIEIPVESQSKTKTSILWVSRYLPMKRPDLFLDLCRIFPTEQFVMICPVSSGFEEGWCKLKERASCISNLNFIEFVPLNEIQSYFNEAKVFVNTSEFEGFPNTFLQAGIAGTPILSLCVDPDGFVNKFACGINCNNDINLFTQSLKDVLSRLPHFSNNIWQFISSNFSKSGLKESLSSFFEYKIDAHEPQARKL